MGNFQRLLEAENTNFEVVGFAEQLSGAGPQVRDLGPLLAPKVYKTAAEFLYAQILAGQELQGGEMLLYDVYADRWATLSFAVADSISIEPVTDTI